MTNIDTLIKEKQTILWYNLFSRFIFTLDYPQCNSTGKHYVKTWYPCWASPPGLWYESSVRSIGASLVYSFSFFISFKLFNANYLIHESSYQIYFVLKPSQGQKPTLFQRMSHLVSKWPRKTRIHIITHFCIFY